MCRSKEFSTFGLGYVEDPPVPQIGGANAPLVWAFGALLAGAGPVFAAYGRRHRG